MARLNILIAEDNPADQKLVLQGLKDSSNSTSSYVVGDGMEALEFLYQKGPFQSAPRVDLLLIDLNLPKLHGIEVLEKIKQDPNLQKIPAVIFTSSNAKKDIATAYEKGAAAYVVKPLDITQYFDLLKSIQSFWLKHNNYSAP